MNISGLKKPKRIILDYGDFQVDMIPPKDFEHLFFITTDEIAALLIEHELINAPEPLILIKD